MNPGSIEAIHLADGEGQPARAVEHARLIRGVGLEGDRYATGRGHFSETAGSGRALTLIEAEALEAIGLHASDARRNLTTRGIALNDLVGVRFRVGGVLCVGTRLCHPCAYLEEVVGRPLIGPLRNRGGLRADVLEDGEIRVGDAIVV